MLANIYGVSRGEIEARERRRQAEQWRVRLTASAVLMAVLATLTVWALVSRQAAISRELAANAVAAISVDPERAIALAVRALEASRTPLAEEALQAMVASANYGPYDGIAAYRELGYVPIDEEGEAASKTLEYAKGQFSELRSFVVTA